MTQYNVVFTGRVQGVGFRFTTRDMARDLGLVGWVKNLPDGTVEMLAEGEEAALDELLARLKAYFQGHIRDASVHKAPGSGACTTFEIVF